MASVELGEGDVIDVFGTPSLVNLGQKLRKVCVGWLCPASPFPFCFDKELNVCLLFQRRIRTQGNSASTQTWKFPGGWTLNYVFKSLPAHFCVWASEINLLQHMVHGSSHSVRWRNENKRTFGDGSLSAFNDDWALCCLFGLTGTCTPYLLDLVHGSELLSLHSLGFPLSLVSHSSPLVGRWSQTSPLVQIKPVSFSRLPLWSWMFPSSF